MLTSVARALVAVSVLAAPAFAAETVEPAATPVPTTLARAAVAPVIDGKFDDACWKDAVLVPIDNPNDRGKPKLEPAPAVARYAWDEHYLYLAYETFDRNLVAEGSGDVQGPEKNRRDGASIWMQGKKIDVVEFFISLGDQHFFWELHHNARNQFNDVFCVTTDPSWPIHQAAFNRWGIMFLEKEYIQDDGDGTFACAVQLKPKADGTPSTISKEDDVDTGYTAELRIPWLSLGVPAARAVKGKQGEWQLDGQTLALLAVVQDGDLGQRYHRSGPFGSSNWFHLDWAVWPRYVLGGK